MSRFPSRPDPVPGAARAGIPLLFSHIPRTGGSTLKFMLQSVFGLDRSVLDVHLFDAKEEDFGEYSFVEGHLAAGFFTNAFGVSWTTNGFTMLRDPITRTVSQARHIRARPGKFQTRLHSAVRNPGDVFEQMPRLANLQTRYLSRTPIDAKSVEDDALDEAKAMLDRVAFGTTENFDSSVALLVERFQLNIPRFDVRNVSAQEGDDDLRSEEFRATVREHNLLDIQLYEYASARLRDRIDHYTGALLALTPVPRPLTCGLRFRGRPVGEHLPAPAETVTARLSGWVLVNGHAADAVLVRVGAQVTPLTPRVERDDAARSTRDLHNRFAGVLGTLTIPADADCVEIIAFDRTRRAKGEHRIAIERRAQKPLLERSAELAKARIGKLRRREPGEEG